MTIKIKAEFDHELEIPNFRTFHDAYFHAKEKHFGNSFPKPDDIIYDNNGRVVGGTYEGKTDAGQVVTFRLEETV